ncbi:MAG TPA: right-handed parallel beta-helix repeat-containing protein [Planctomycetota bacterium]|nr:right-handed parallel beta-helix repeat-containing protein [Planctomycetota bacterium]
MRNSSGTRARLLLVLVGAAGIAAHCVPSAHCGPSAHAAEETAGGGFEVTEGPEELRLVSAALEATVRKRGYVSGVAGGSFLDKRTGFRDSGFGLDIVDWLMEPGSDEAYRERLPGDLPYDFNNLYHGRIAKRSVEGPQICTQAKELFPRLIRGPDFTAVEMDWRYRIAPPGKKTGSEWRQALVFPAGKRYFLSADRVVTVNDSEALFLRLDMPGHLKHQRGDTFSEVYLSYEGRLPAGAFLEDFPPDGRHLYRREEGKLPRRFIRAYRLRDPRTGQEGPWLAGMTLDPASVWEAWCHQRGYVCMIQEIGGRPVRAGESFGAAFIVGFFDSIEEMHEVYDRHAGHDALEVNEKGWRLVKSAFPSRGVPGTGSASRSAGAAPRPELRVGITEGDLRGDDHRVLQAAVDQLAAQGGGVVRIGPGRFLMRNALKLRSGVDVIGTQGETVLVASDGVTSRLALDGDCNERQVTLEEPAGFRVGDGIAVKDSGYGGGFEVTTATLTEQLDRRTFRISAPLYLDYLVSRRATASLAFPVVGGWQVRDVTVEGLTIEGNGGKTPHLDGCRGAGIYLFECEGVTIRRSTVRGYNGDGISFQVSPGITVEECLVEGNKGLGLHPGSGSERPVVRENRSFSNGGDGLFVCWRVQHGLFEGNELRDNGGAGVSIGHKDSDNLFRRNRILKNGGPGVLFRAESEPMGAHRNVFEQNEILDNGRTAEGKAAHASVVIRGHHHGLVFRKNTLGLSEPGGPGAAGILAGPDVKLLVTEGNILQHLETELKRGEYGSRQSPPFPSPVPVPGLGLGSGNPPPRAPPFVERPYTRTI